MEGVWLDDVHNGLWNMDMIDRSRILRTPEELRHIVIGVDPAVTGNANSDETGIVAAGMDESGDFYVLKDASLRSTPLVWAQTVERLFELLRRGRLSG